MPRAAESRKSRLAVWLEEHRPGCIDQECRRQLAQYLAPVSESYLRALLLHSGLPLAPLVEGVRLDSLAELERTLLALEREYSTAGPQEARKIRDVVLEGKNRAGWQLRRAPESERATRAEAVLWIRTWLENPVVFPVWLRLRHARLLR